jgi:hypothetical protein
LDDAEAENLSLSVRGHRARGRTQGGEHVADDEVLRVLRSIDRRLALLTGPQEREVRRRITTDLLRTPTRLAMFDAIDGETGSPELAKMAGVSERAAQQLVKDPLDLGLVKVVRATTGRGFVVATDEDAIGQWHLAAAAKESDASNLPPG